MNEKKDFVRDVIKQLMLVHMDFSQVVSCLDQKKEMRAGAIIGGRTEVLNGLFTELFKDSEFKKVMSDCMGELNDDLEKRMKSEDKVNKFSKQSYMG